MILRPPHDESRKGSVCSLPLFGLVLIVFLSISVMLSESWALPNPIQRENERSGTQDWRLSKPALSHEIEGYASLTSVESWWPYQFLCPHTGSLLQHRDLPDGLVWG